jgi:hypothetical protein
VISAQSAEKSSPATTDFSMGLWIQVPSDCFLCVKSSGTHWNTAGFSLNSGYEGLCTWACRLGAKAYGHRYMLAFRTCHGSVLLWPYLKFVATPTANSQYRATSSKLSRCSRMLTLLMVFQVQRCDLKCDATKPFHDSFEEHISVVSHRSRILKYRNLYERCMKASSLGSSSSTGVIILS